MQKAEAQHKHAQPAQRQGGVAALESPQAERIAQLEAIADASPQIGRLAQLVAMVDASPAMSAQRKAVDIAQRAEANAKPNNTGLPDNLKSGIESLSGMAMDNVKVHYNSSQPAQLNALAYAQGTDIHVAPGQEQHLPHEAWHVVQQAQGRVKPTMQMKDGVPVNDDAGLEHEADVMGNKAVQLMRAQNSENAPVRSQGVVTSVVQCANQIHSHNITANDSPIKQVINFVATETGENSSNIKDNIKNNLAATNGIGAHVDELINGSADARADSIDVTIDTPTGGGSRTTLITALGKLGYFEGLLRGGGGDFDGGHLVALSHWNNWTHINNANNVVPQDRSDNRWGVWRAQERAVSNYASTSTPYRFTSTATYPDTSYAVTLDTIKNQMLSDGIASLVTGSNGSHVVNLNTRRPTAVSHTLAAPATVDATTWV